MAKNSFVAEVTFKINIRTNTLFNLGGNYMIPVSQDEILSRFAGVLAML